MTDELWTVEANRIKIKPVVELVCVQGNVANLDYAYTKDSIATHIQAAFDDGCDLVVVKYRGKVYHCTRKGDTYEREEAPESPYAICFAIPAKKGSEPQDERS